MQLCFGGTNSQQREKQKRKAEGKLHLKRQEMDKAKVRDRHSPCFASLFLTNSYIPDAVRRYSYLDGTV